MAKVTLYDQKNINGTYNIEVSVDLASQKKIDKSKIKETIKLDGIVLKGNTENTGLVYIKPVYEELLSNGIALENVKVLSINGKAINPNISGNLCPEKTPIVIEGTRKKK